jgi:hypothetical protein
MDPAHGSMLNSQRQPQQRYVIQTSSFQQQLDCRASRNKTTTAEDLDRSVYLEAVAVVAFTWNVAKASIAICTKDSAIVMLVRGSSSASTATHSLKLVLTSFR